MTDKKDGVQLASIKFTEKKGNKYEGTYLASIWRNYREDGNTYESITFSVGANKQYSKCNSITFHTDDGDKTFSAEKGKKFFNVFLNDDIDVIIPGEDSDGADTVELDDEGDWNK